MSIFPICLLARLNLRVIQCILCHFSHALGSPSMVYSRSSIQHVDWDLDSGEVSRSIGQLFYIKFNGSSNTNAIHIIQSNSSNLMQQNFVFLQFVRVCMCVCMLVCVNRIL